MAEKNINNVRIINKHDTEANWQKATGFTPKQGELIVYDVDTNYSYERIKIGDGVQNVNDLPFCVVNWDDLANKPFKPDIKLICEYSATLPAGTAKTTDALAPVGYLGSDRRKYFHDNAILTVRIGETEWNLDKSHLVLSSSYITVGQYNGIDVKLLCRNHRESALYCVDLVISASLTEDVDIYMSYGLLFDIIDQNNLPETIATKEYVDAAIEAIPTPDVSGQIEVHNISETAHSDIRTAISDVSALVGDTKVSDQINSALGEATADDFGIYVQAQEPTDAVAGDIWIDTANDPSYIPPTIPEITESDNGKVLMVVNGKLQLVSLNLSVDANGVVFM